MAEYQQLYDVMTQQISGTVLRYRDQAYIPDDPANRDRQTYLQWLDEGNVPDPPDPLPEPSPPVPDANARIDAGAKAAVETYQEAPMPPPEVSGTAGQAGGLPEINARLSRLETTLQAWVEGQMADTQGVSARRVR